VIVDAALTNWRLSVKKFAKVLLGTSLFLLEQLDRSATHAQGRIGSRLDDLRDLAQEKYEAGADSVARTTKALRNGHQNHAIRNSLGFVAGVGVGVGVALLTAPATGEETRTAIAERAQRFGNNVQKRFTAGGPAAMVTGD
jgi:YtxH-like protein